MVLVYKAHVNYIPTHLSNHLAHCRLEKLPPNLVFMLFAVLSTTCSHNSSQTKGVDHLRASTRGKQDISEARNLCRTLPRPQCLVHPMTRVHHKSTPSFSIRTRPALLSSSTKSSTPHQWHPCQVHTMCSILSLSLSMICMATHKQCSSVLCHLLA